MGNITVYLIKAGDGWNAYESLEEAKEQAEDGDKIYRAVLDTIGTLKHVIDENNK